MKSVEQFWNVYSHIQRPQGNTYLNLLFAILFSEFEKGSDKTDLHFFKQGIKPVWEDPSNVEGGKWILRVKKVVIRYVVHN